MKADPMRSFTYASWTSAAGGDVGVQVPSVMWRRPSVGVSAFGRQVGHPSTVGSLRAGIATPSNRGLQPSVELYRAYIIRRGRSVKQSVRNRHDKKTCPYITACRWVNDLPKLGVAENAYARHQ